MLVSLAGLAGPAAVTAGAARPDPDVRAGARALPDRAFLRATTARCDAYVDAGAGKDTNGGGAGAPWATIGKATATLTRGQVACVRSGTYPESGARTAHAGAPSAPIVLRRAPGSPTRPVVRLTAHRPLLDVRHAFWIVSGLELDLNRRRTSGIVLRPGAHHVGLLDAYVHDDARGAAVYVAAEDVTIERSEIARNFHHQAGQDSHGVLIAQGAARVLVRRNRIHDNGGDGVQCEYVGGATDAEAPADVTIEDNRMWTSPANQGRTEQAIDIKSCRNVSIRGSVPPDADDPAAAGQKLFGFKATSAGAGGGGAIVVHLAARNVLIENNRMWDSCHGIGIGRHDAALGVVEDVVVRRNVIFDMKTMGGTGSHCRGYGINIQHVRRADVVHNTFDRLPAYAFRVALDNETGQRTVGVDFWNNLVRDARSFLEVAGADRLAGFVSDHNLFWWSRSGGQRRFRAGGRHTLDGWRGRANGTSVRVADPHSLVRSPDLIAGAGMTDDYLTRPTSPARRIGLDNMNALSADGRPDVGFRETYDRPARGARCQTGRAGERWPARAFAARTGRFTAIVDATPLGAPVAGAVGLGRGPAQAWTDLAAIVRFDDVTGRIDARDGGAYRAATRIRYVTNTRYRVRLVVDVPARRYSAYITPPGGRELTLGVGLAFRTEQAGVSALDTRTVATGIGAVQSCGLTLTGAQPIPGPTIAAAGDIAGEGSGDEATAALLDALSPAAVLTTGDNAYPKGTAAQFRDFYAPTWGRHRAITRPTPGNHDYETDGAAGYFGYFGSAAGDPRRGYYSWDLGAWHLIALNSEVPRGPGSPQLEWLRRDLAASSARCMLAYAHRPRFTRGRYSDFRSERWLWRTLHDAGVDVVLAGHDHNYQRFVPLDGDGARSSGGPRQFVVGTGGRSRYDLRADGRRAAGTDDTYGVLALTLHADRFDWRFVPATGTFSDAGSASCR